MLNSFQYDEDNLLFETFDEITDEDNIHAQLSLQSLEVRLTAAEEKSKQYDEMVRQDNLPEDSFLGDFRLLKNWMSNTLTRLTNFLQGHDYADKLAAEIYNK